VHALLGRYLARAPEEILAPFAREGEVKVRMWLRLPRATDAGHRAALDVDEHLFHGFMPLRAKPPPRARRTKLVPAGDGAARPSGQGEENQ
jgi:hypothetical protein